MKVGTLGAAAPLLVLSCAVVGEPVLVPLSIERGVRVHSLENGVPITISHSSMAPGLYERNFHIDNLLWGVSASQRSVLGPQGRFSGGGTGFPATDPFCGVPLALEGKSWAEYEFELTKPAYIDLRGVLHAGYYVKDLIIGAPFARVTLYGPDNEVVLLADRPASEDYKEHTEFFTSLTQKFPAGQYRLSVIANGNLETWGNDCTWGSGDADWSVFLDAAETPSPGCPSVEPYLISAAPDGTPGDDESTLPSISHDGRFVAFYSRATNLAPQSTNNEWHLFLYDRQNRITRYVGRFEPHWSLERPPVVSGDGTSIVLSLPWAHDEGDINGDEDVYAVDVATGALEIISVSNEGMTVHWGASSDPSISSDGQRVAFQSSSAWDPFDDYIIMGVYVRFRDTDTTVRIDRSPLGERANGMAARARISADGRKVAFRSAASNLVADDTNGVPDVFLADVDSGVIERVSVTPDGGNANGPSYGAAISEDGRYVVFTSAASNLVSGDTNGKDDVFLRDMESGATILVSAALTGGSGNGASSSPSISADGRYVAFVSAASNLVVGDANNRADFFLFDRERSLIRRVNVSRFGVVSPHVSQFSRVALSGDGQYIAFDAPDTIFVPHDTNDAHDVFLCWVGDAFDRTPGDTNYDGRVDFADLNVLLGQFGASGPTLGADFNGDGVVDFADLNALLGNFGADCG